MYCYTYIHTQPLPWCAPRPTPNFFVLKKVVRPSGGRAGQVEARGQAQAVPAHQGHEGTLDGRKIWLPISCYLGYRGREVG